MGRNHYATDVDLALEDAADLCCQGQFLVLTNVPRGRSRLDVEPGDQVLTTDFAQEAQAQLDGREAVALERLILKGVRQTC